MDLVEFPEHNIVIAKDQPQYRPLPAHRYPGDASGRIVCCWALSWKERIRLLFTGRVWHEILTFGHALQPQLLAVEKPPMGAADSPALAFCIGCGCSDLHACRGGCSWLRVDRALGKGICSSCPALVATWDAGKSAAPPPSSMPAVLRRRALRG